MIDLNYINGYYPAQFAGNATFHIKFQRFDRLFRQLLAGVSPHRSRHPVPILPQVSDKPSGVAFACFPQHPSGRLLQQPVVPGLCCGTP